MTGCDFPNIKGDGTGRVGGEAETCLNITHGGGNNVPLTTVLSARPGRYVYSPFTISNPV